MKTLGKYQPTRLNGFVTFEIPDIIHPSFPKVTVTGKYLRIQPHTFRPEVDPAIVDEISEKYCKLANQYGFGDHHFKRYSIKTMILTAVQFALYWNPWVDLRSKQMDFMMRKNIWLWFFDDAMEEFWTSKSPTVGGKKHISKLQIVHSTYLKIFHGTWNSKEELPSFPEYPQLGAMCAWINDVVKLGVEIRGDEYFKECDHLIRIFQTIVDCNHWFTVNPVDGRYTQSTYHFWRVVNAGGNFVLELTAIMMDIRIPLEIRRHPAFDRLITIAMTNAQLVNDVLGVRKDFSYGNGDLDNEVVFHVLHKNESVQEAVDALCDMINGDLHDLLLIKEALIDIFGEEENLVNFFDLIDLFIDGHNFIYVNNIRYKCERGFVRLSRDEELNGVVTKQAII